VTNWLAEVTCQELSMTEVDCQKIVKNKRLSCQEVVGDEVGTSELRR